MVDQRDGVLQLSSSFTDCILIDFDSGVDDAARIDIICSMTPGRLHALNRHTTTIFITVHFGSRCLGLDLESFGIQRYLNRQLDTSEVILVWVGNNPDSALTLLELDSLGSSDQ